MYICYQNALLSKELLYFLDYSYILLTSLVFNFAQGMRSADVKYSSMTTITPIPRRVTYQGYGYRFEQQEGNRLRYVCQRCSSRMSTNVELTEVRVGKVPHNHEPLALVDDKNNYYNVDRCDNLTSILI